MISKILVICLIFTIGNSSAEIKQSCIGCICSAASDCDSSAKCEGDVCGAFKITKPFWIDSGKPVVNNDSPDSEEAYQNCALDLYCAARAVQGYMTKYQKDCNNDGKIDCDDFVTIHKFGESGCVGATITGVFKERYSACQEYVHSQNPQE